MILSWITRVLVSTVSVKRMVRRPKFISKWYMSTSGGVVSSTKVDTCNPWPSSMGTMELLYMSSRASEVNRIYVLSAEVARFRSFLI